MKAERWQRVKELLNEALDREPAHRSAFLNEHCVGDPDLRNEIDSLLSSFDDADDFMEDAPPVTAAPKITTSSGGAAPARALESTGMRIGPVMHIGQWRVLEEIGRGGMGTVYRAVHVDDPLNVPVALKIIRRGMDHDFILRRFRNERTILAALDHPNISKLIDGGATPDGLPWFVMEFVDGGRTILEYCDQECLDTRARLLLFVSVCSAVQCAHDRRIIHRDIKPGNILINSAGQAKLLDFGIAKILDPELSPSGLDATATILRLMTPEYASPEQVRGREITTTSDVYSLGVLLYELLTGHRPYRIRSRSPHEIAQVICDETPERPSTMVGRTELVTRPTGPLTLTPDVVGSARRSRPTELRRTLSGGLDNIVLMAIRKEPERRYASAGDFAADILRYLSGQNVKARPDTAQYRFAKVIRRNRTAFATSAAVLFLAAGLTAIWIDIVAPKLNGPPAAPKTVPLTSFPGDETQPDFSPDGSRIAFVWAGENGNNSDIYIKPVRGVGIERITTNTAEDVSPTWSPDGKLIAWLRANPTETAIYTSLSRPGDMHRKVTTLYSNRIEAVGRHLDWGPDSKSLAASDKSSADEPFRIVLIDLATGNKTSLTNPPPGTVGDSNPAFSPDGRQVAFIRGVSSGVDDAFVRTIATGQERRLTTDKRYIISLAWSSDGRSILFSSNRAGNHSLWRVPAVGARPPEPLASVGENVSDPVLSLNGSLLAYSQFYLDTNIWALNLQTSARRKLIASTQYDSSPYHSADGTKIVFRSSRSGTSEIWLANPDGTEETQVTHMGSTLTGSPKLSPDGRRIAFDSRPSGQPDIFVIGVDGSDQRRLVSDASEDVVPSWSRDGKWIYFASNRNGSWQLWKISPEGGTPTQVTSTGAFAGRESFDGKWIYYARGRSLAGLWRVRPDGTGPEQVLENLKPGLWAHWSLTRQGIYFADREQGQSAYMLYFLRDGFKVPQRVAAFDKPLVIGDQGFSTSPDGRTLLYAQVDQSGSDILMVDMPKTR